jgi:hypothetical protein
VLTDGTSTKDVGTAQEPSQTSVETKATPGELMLPQSKPLLAPEGEQNGSPTKDVGTAVDPSHTPAESNQTAVEPTQTEVIQGHIKPDEPTLPAPIDKEAPSPSKDVATAIDPSLSGNLTWLQ